MAQPIDGDDLSKNFQDMLGSGYEPAKEVITAVKVTPDVNNEIESSTTSDPWQTIAAPYAWEPIRISSDLEPSTAFDEIKPTTTSSELEPSTEFDEIKPTTISSELEPSTAFDEDKPTTIFNAWESTATSSEAEATTIIDWRDEFQSIETSKFDEKLTPTASIDDNSQDQQIAGILRTIAGIINEENSDSYSTFLSSSPAVETEMPMSSALVQEANDKRPSISIIENANAAFESPVMPASSTILDTFESSTLAIANNAHTATSAFFTATYSNSQTSSVPQPSMNIHIPDGVDQKVASPANGTPEPSHRILAPDPVNNDGKTSSGQANPAPLPSKSQDANDPKASPPPGDKPNASPSPGKDAAKPSNSPVSGNPPNDAPNGDSSAPGTAQPPPKPNSPPGGGSPGSNRGGPGVDYGGPFSGKSDSSSGSGKTSDEDLGAIGQIGVFESSATSQHMALISVWTWIVALVVIWTTLRHREYFT